MKKVKYPNLDDYDLSDYVELKGDILYKINGGAMSDADQAAMAEAGKNGDAQKQAEIRAKYEAKGSTSTSTSTGTNGLSKPTSTATSAAPTQTDAPAKSTALDHGQQAEMAKQDAEKKTGTSGSSASSYSGGVSSGDNSSCGSGYSGGAPSNSSKSSDRQSCAPSISREPQYETEVQIAAGKKEVSGIVSNSSANNCQRITPKATNKYAVDYESRSIKVDIKDRESYERALGACLKESSDYGVEFKLQITDGKDVIHTFSDMETATKFVFEKGIMTDLIPNEKNVEAFVRNIEQNPDNYYMEAYQRRALGRGEKTDLMTHSLYLITNKTTGEKSTLSFNGTMLFPRSVGAWGLNTDKDVKGWNSLVDGENGYDMSLLTRRESIDVQQTASKIINSINSNVTYYYKDHLNDKSNMENCNTALFATEVIRRQQF